MKRELFIHFSFWFSFFTLILIFKGEFNLTSWPFWIGGILGTILPDIDHVIYIYLTRPYELTSQRFFQFINSKELLRGVQLLYETRTERTELIFHSKFFQIMFLVVVFWVMSSSGSSFGQGVALSFAVHLAVDRIIDIYDLSLNNDKNEKIFLTIVSLFTVIVGFI